MAKLDNEERERLYVAAKAARYQELKRPARMAAMALVEVPELLDQITTLEDDIQLAIRLRREDQKAAQIAIASLNREIEQPRSLGWHIRRWWSTR
jgi:hypothetical protein